MAEIKLEPYLFFNGQCKEAVEFYKSVFGGEVELQTYAESGQKMEGAEDNWIMHAKLETPSFTIMASDTAQASPEAKKITLSLGGDEADEADLRQTFDKLSEGGEVTQPLSKQFWGDTYGQLVDKYGIEWMMNIAGPKTDSK